MDFIYVAYEICECPRKPQESGKLIGRTPILQQAMEACDRGMSMGMSCFIKGVTASGSKVVIL